MSRGFTSRRGLAAARAAAWHVDQSIRLITNTLRQQQATGPRGGRSSLRSFTLPRYRSAARRAFGSIKIPDPSLVKVERPLLDCRGVVRTSCQIDDDMTDARHATIESPDYFGYSCAQSLNQDQ